MNPQRYSTDITRPALSPVTPVDHAGQVWILTILTTIYAGLSLLVRGSIKWNVFWLDDYLLATATAIHFAQAGVVFSGLSHGLAKFNSITTESQWELSGRAFFVSEILAVIALSLSKCSVWALLLRIFMAGGAFNDWRVKTCLGFVFLGAAWGVVAVIGITTSCDPESMLSPGRANHCPGQPARWQTITIIDIVTEVLGCLLPVVLVWSLNMPTRNRFHVFLAFSFRLPLVALSIIHLKYTRGYLQSTEPLFAVTATLLCQQAMLAWSLISATIPNIKSFMRVFNFSMGMGTTDEGLSQQTPASIALQSLQDQTGSSQYGGTRNADKPVSRANLASKRNTYSSTGGGTTDDERSLMRNDSQEMIIRKEIEAPVPPTSNEEVAAGKP
ncbi:hypothetical protein VPNG_00245 [Cytospora leucostoma]|uniref:Rhodopsin domain-containing protein n=1 Tax=Cytospora leucostoma TaxID=1230097 RepID=A0A423XP58_9PEZI|nr:hypothetical protein VPNG_00245 [Cytospora leucostoma]